MGGPEDHPDLFPTVIPQSFKISPREYQFVARDLLREGLRNGHKRQMLCLPTGSGKTVVAGMLTSEAIIKGKKVLFAADRISLVSQTSMRMSEAGIPHGMVQGENRWGFNQPVHVWSSQTLEASARKGGSIEDVLKRYDLLIIDEAHTKRQALIDAMVNVDMPVIGLSATPFTAGLGKIYSNLVTARTTDQLTDDGFLVPFEMYIGEPVDTEGAPTNSAGEWTPEGMQPRVLKIVGDTVAWYHKLSHEALWPIPQDDALLC